MGATLSSPQLGDGLITAPGPGPPGPFATAFYVAATDTNSLGFTASVLWGTAMEARYTNTASVEKTVFCSQVQNDPSQTNPFSVSVLCPVANTQLGTGPVIFSLGNPGDGPATYAIYVGRTTATAGPALVTTTAIVPGLTTYLATVTSTVYETTETVAITTTLTGQYSVSHCPTSPISSPTTLSTSTRSASSSPESSKIFSSSGAQSSHQTGSASTRLSSASSTKISSSSSLTHGSSHIRTSSSSRTTSSSKVSSTTSSLSRTSSFSKVTSSAGVIPSAKSSVSRLSKSSASTSKSTSSKATSKTTSSKISSRLISSSKIISTPLCSTGVIVKSLSSHPSIASHLCQDILSTKQAFPSSISVWPASQLSSACSCFEISPTTRLAIQTKGALVKRTTAVAGFSSATVSEDPNTDGTLHKSSSLSSSSTTLGPTSIAGYGPPTMSFVPTITLSTTGTDTVYVTGNPTILPTTTVMVSIGTTTVKTNSTVTIDERASPTTCFSSLEGTKVTLSARSLTCTNLKLHTAFLWVMMKDPFDFCAYYLTANRNTSPLLEMGASTLKDTCSCLMTHKSAPLPAFKVGPAYLPKPKRQCNQSVASLIKAKFKEPKTFCKYYTSTSRNISPFSVLKPADVFAGCSCLI